MFTHDEEMLLLSLMDSKDGLDMVALDRIIDRCGEECPYNELYRGISARQLKEVQTLGVGDTIVTRRPMSFTPNGEIAANFADEVYHTDAVFLIKTPSTCFHYYPVAVDMLQKHKQDGIFQSMIMLADERECLYQTGTTFKLVDIEKDPVHNHITVYTLEVE